MPRSVSPYFTADDDARLLARIVAAQGTPRRCTARQLAAEHGVQERAIARAVRRAARAAGITPPSLGKEIAVGTRRALRQALAAGVTPYTAALRLRAEGLQISVSAAYRFAAECRQAESRRAA